MSLSYLPRLIKNPYKILIAHDKGGVGKSMIAVNLTHGLKMRGIDCVLIDADKHQETSFKWHLRSGGQLIDCVNLKDDENLDVQVGPISRGYHCVIMDCGSNAGNVLGKAIRAADLVLIPMVLAPFDLWATQQLVDIINMRRDVCDKPDAAFIINRVHKNRILNNKFEADIKEFGFPILMRKLTEYVLYSKSADVGHSIFSKGDNEAASEFNVIIEEIITRYISREQIV